MNYKLSPRLKRYFDDIEIKKMMNNNIFEFQKKRQEFFNSEIRRVFDHFGLTFDEVKKRAKFGTDIDGNQILWIDDKQVLTFSMPEISGAQVIQRVKRLYKERRNDA
ncbi:MULTISPECIES: hypothetical protein [Bacillus subtilis group]|uniref:hypothetical protein n=1 Tax=Bacillus subtilis group TaxID=653685 RepID=UPI0009B7A362|nr:MULTISPECIES: hypothetical protein [Bacillus subtilis group]ARC72542.1 hypothetical protein B37_00489 [Bacillus licheniformis]ARW41676.1 hypothetical protein S100141_00353 [Bacillus licheniformis]ARW56527.1 hypothetical protein S100027_04563 [Bacillus licheniformis]AXF87796.1 hypothetical protein BLDA23_05720 [Bacillus licheniformis]MCA1182440.1 hypothetical protein [Bacillus licheniformis]